MIDNTTDIIYVEVKDGIVVNRLLGSTGNPLDAENLFLLKYPVAIGWKQISEDMFIPSTMTEEEWNILSVKTKQSINTTKEYYDKFVLSAHYINDVPEETKKQIQTFIKEFAEVHEKINQHDGWILNYLENILSYGEPLRPRPNIEIEV
jgi:hypothetical protein